MYKRIIQKRNMTNLNLLQGPFPLSLQQAVSLIHLVEWSTAPTWEKITSGHLWTLPDITD